MTALDHLVAVVLVLVFPIYSAWDVPRLARRVAADPLYARTRDYFWNMAILWGLTIALFAAWRWAARPVRDLGLRLPEGATAWWWTFLICAVVVGFIVQQAYSVLRSPSAQAEVREKLESNPALRTVLPSTPEELRVFFGVAVTAGVCEELLYRGYLLWYFQAFLPAGAAAGAAILAFGVAHAYQGLRGIASTGLAGAVAMTVYLLAGSLLAPIVLHAVLDLVNGFTIYRACRAPAAPNDL